MKKSPLHRAMALALFLASVGVASAPFAEAAEQPPLRLWYDQPAKGWKEGLPIGNGEIGAMVLGGVDRERLSLNHDRLWRKMKEPREIPDVADNLEEIRKLFFEGKIVEASNMANAKLGSRREARGVEPYQPAGDLHIDFVDQPEVTNYQRELNLDEGIARVQYEIGGVQFHREMFASCPDKVIVTRLDANKPGQLNCDIQLSRVDDPDCTITPWAEGEYIGYTGAFPEGVEFAVGARVFITGGVAKLETTEKTASLSCRRTNVATIVLALATNNETDAPKEVVQERLAHFDATGVYERLKEDHLDDYRSLFGRVDLELASDPDLDAMPTDKRLARMREDKLDPGLQRLYFQYGRYLLMSSSRPGSMPANLQGLWSESIRPAWNADFHHDVNLEMNYWPAEVCNLSECADPLLAYLDRMMPRGREAARKYYGCDGVYIPITGDIWAECLKAAPGWDEWIGAGGWLGQHYWWRWAYRDDKQFLRERIYPYLKSIATFYEDYLVEDPRENHRFHGKLVPVPSQSPENRFKGGISPVSLCIGATMDLEIIHETLTHAIRASQILGVDADRRAQWRLVIDRLPPLQIGKHGQLQEWLEDYDEAEPGHRHFSHLVGLYPGDQITIEKTPQLAEAARVSIKRRLAAQGGHTGWSRSWLVGMFARLRDGDQAEYHLRHLITDFATKTLLDLCGRVFQIDGNFGGTAGLAEMLLQSHEGKIRLLPALPQAWPEGSVSGLRARGGFEVDMAWKDGALTHATIRSDLGRPCVVECGAKNIAFDTKEGATYDFDGNLRKVAQ